MQGPGSGSNVQQPGTNGATPNLRGLLVAQFLGTFVVNAWTLLVALIAAHTAAAASAAEREAAFQLALGTAFAAGIVPMALASLPAARLADRIAKPRLLRVMALVLAGLMAAAVVVLARDAAPSRWALLAIVVLVGVQAALFSPAKYGVVPELVPHDRLSEANGRLELSTFVAIVAGAAAAGPLYDWSRSRPWIAAAILLALSIASWLAARTIPDLPATGAREGFRATLQGAWMRLRADRVLGMAVIGSIGFWGLGKFLAQNVLVDARSRLGWSESAAPAALALLVVGIGAGSVAAGRLSARKVEVGLLPLGAFTMAASCALLGLWGPGSLGSLLLLIALGLFSGFLLVPLNALIQWRAPQDRRGAVIALSNAFVFAGIAVGAGLATLLAQYGMSTLGLYVVAAGTLFAGALWATSLAPLALLRLVLFLLTHTFYRLRVNGRENVPETGGALLVPNHVSFVDGLLIIASLDRPVRFIVDATFFDRPIVGAVLRALGAIPISSSGGPKLILRAFRDAGKHLDDGHLVCIFAEGQITRTGIMNAFRRGLQRIVKGRDAPVIPVHLDGIWGSIFSFAGGRFVRKLPERVPYPVQVSFGTKLPPTTPIDAIRRAVQDLGEQAWQARRRDAQPLHRRFLGQVRRQPWALLFADARLPRVSRFKAAAGAIALARAIRASTGLAPGERIGLLLPPSVGGALGNFAVTFLGRASVNLNYTAGPAAIRSAASQAGLRFVLTTAEFLAKAKVELPSGVTPLFLDELLRAIPRGERVLAALLALLVPARLVERACGAPRTQVDDPVTVIFSSGSTGEPKGVVLTHFNVGSNLDSLAQAFRITRHDRILGILPFFHSFGFTATLWFPACKGLSAVFHPTPMDTAAISDLVERHQVTFLLATPTLLALYLRRCTPAQFGSLRLVLAGAEKLPDRLAEAFESHFGIRPLEGYGATECSPVIAASTFDFRAPGFYQPGWRRGTVGQPIPGVTVRVVDPDTLAPLPSGERGLLLVRGPNVMQGYLGRPDLTAQAIRDGWYVTGDLAVVDEDGFIAISDRLARFSKIGGEMVPHGRVEDELHKAAGATTPTFAVTALPDDKKGERLAVLTTLPRARIDAVLEKLGASGLPNLFLPRADAFVEVAELPMLGTGKLDLRAVRRIAGEAFAAKARAGAETA